MSAPSNLGAVTYVEEASFAENSSSMAGAKRLPILSEVDLSGFTWEAIDQGYTQQYRNEGQPHVRGTMGGSVQLTMPAMGHGSATTGALSETDLADFLGLVIGNNDAASEGTTATGGTAAAPTLAGGAFAVGSLTRVGVNRDGRGGGQGAIVDNLAAGTLTLRNALPGAPSNGDVVHALEHVFPEENSSSSEVTGLRMLFQTGDLQVLAHGCHATAIALNNLNAGQVPQWQVTMSCAWFEHVSSTFPNATSLQAFKPAMVGAGSFHYNTVGTTTRQTLDVRSFALELDYQYAAHVGVGGVHTHQSITSVTRHKIGAMFTITVDSEAATATPDLFGKWDDDANDASAFEVVYTLSVAQKSALVLAFPSAYLVAPAPMQRPNEGIGMIDLKFEARTNTVQSTTTDLALSAWRLGMG